MIRDESEPATLRARFALATYRGLLCYECGQRSCRTDLTSESAEAVHREQPSAPVRWNLRAYLGSRTGQKRVPCHLASICPCFSPPDEPLRTLVGGEPAGCLTEALPSWTHTFPAGGSLRLSAAPAQERGAEGCLLRLTVIEPMFDSPYLVGTISGQASPRGRARPGDVAPHATHRRASPSKHMQMLGFAP